MTGGTDRFCGDARVLHQRAVRIPLPDADAERAFHENAKTLAAAEERRASLLADPDVPLLAAFETSFEHAAQIIEQRLEQIAGEEYEDVAMAYYRDERDDQIAEIAAYFIEGLWRIQQSATVTEMLYTPLIMRYPDCFTVNVRFASDYTTPKSTYYESPEHAAEELDDEYAETYYEESQYSQRRAAAHVREGADLIREEFPDPDETAFDDRKYGGIVMAGGRRGSVFTTMTERVEPDPDRFSEPVDEPTLVEAGPEAARTERELRLEDAIVH
ncbi:hypothetical protein [Halopiger thermotolerans]